MNLRGHTVRDIGVRELKAKASEIVRNVWKRHARYTITYRGRPVGILLPLDKATAPEPGASASSSDPWDELNRLGSSMAKRWPKGKTSGEILSKMRR
jgi:prevent-host-death family protein